MRVIQHNGSVPEMLSVGVTTYGIGLLLGLGGIYS